MKYGKPRKLNTKIAFIVCIFRTKIHVKKSNISIYYQKVMLIAIRTPAPRFLPGEVGLGIVDPLIRIRGLGVDDRDDQPGGVLPIVEDFALGRDEGREEVGEVGVGYVDSDLVARLEQVGGGPDLDHVLVEFSVLGRDRIPVLWVVEGIVAGPGPVGAGRVGPVRCGEPAGGEVPDAAVGEYVVEVHDPVDVGLQGQGRQPPEVDAEVRHPGSLAGRFAELGPGP